MEPRSTKKLSRKNRAKYLNDLDTRMQQALEAVNAAKFDIKSSKPGSPDFVKASLDLDVADTKYKTLQQEYKDFVKNEAQTTLESQIKKLEADKQRKIALNEPVQNVEAQIEKTKSNLNKALNIGAEERRPSLTGITSVPSVGEPAATPVAPPAAPSAPSKGPSKKPKPKTDAEQYADAIELARTKYQMPDILFKNVPSLGKLLNRLVNDELTIDQFSREIELDPWYRSNSQEIKNRYVQLYNYQDLVKSGRAQGTTDYEQRISKITANLQARARELRGAEIDPTEARLMAQDLYIFNQDADDAVVTQRLSRFIKPVAGMIAGQPSTGYSGQALQNYQTLQGIAKANGFKIEDILPRDAAGKPMTAEGILQGIATQQIDINRIAQDARRLAAQGQPDYVKELLAQGYDLENIYAPYKRSMASILEIQNPDQIQLNDPALRMAIGKNGDMNIYEYERALRKDPRWQYTENASRDIAGKTLRVLRDFGFEA